MSDMKLIMENWNKLPAPNRAAALSIFARFMSLDRLQREHS